MIGEYVMKDKNNPAGVGRISAQTVIIVLVAAVFIAGGMLLSSHTSLTVAECTAICLLLYAGTVAFVLLLGNRRPDAARDQSLKPILGNIMLDTVTKHREPVLICDDETGVIIWYNRAASLCSDIKSLYGEKFGDIFTPSHNEAKESPAGTDAEDGVDTDEQFPEYEAAGRIYETEMCRINTSDKEFRLYTLYDVTENRRLSRELAEHETSVAYIMIDNLTELLQNEQEQYRYAAAETDRILREWAAKSGGVIKEYQSDRYIFVFETGKLADFVQSRFEILDEIREIRVGEGSTPVTVSIGVSSFGKSISERERAAQSALDMALQRGGDQVVVKNEASLEFFGGRTKMVQKRTNVRARIIANELLMQISKASGVIIMGHRFGDFDSFGAAAGIAVMAKFCGVDVRIVTDYSNRNLDMCRSWLEDEDGFENVFVSPDKALDLVQTDTLLIIVDVNNPALFDEPKLAEVCDNIAVIDHHRKMAEFIKEPIISYIEPSASATCELVSEMLEQILSGEELTPDIAGLILSGILLDTKQFTKNTGTRTFSAALYLRDHGADVTQVQELFKTDLDEYRREAKFRTNTVIYRGITAIALGEGAGDAGDRIAAAKAADRLLSVTGIAAAFALVVIDNTVHISARSGGDVNVQLILEKLNGGGHFEAAGAQLGGVTLSEALMMLKTEIDRYLDASPEI